MITVRMMQVVGDAVVDVITMRDRFVTAIGAVDMTGLMAAAAMVRGADVGVAARHLDHVLVDMIVVRVVEMPVMQVVGVAAMAHGGVTATRPVAMGMVGVAGLEQVVISLILFVSGHYGAALGRVIDRVLHQRQDVLVGERVVDVLGFAPPLDQARRVERLQARRHGGDLLAFVFGQLRDAGFTLGEPHQKAQPLGVAERLKDRRPASICARDGRRTAGRGGCPPCTASRLTVVSITTFHRSMEYSSEHRRRKTQSLNHGDTEGTEKRQS